MRCLAGRMTMRRKFMRASSGGRSMKCLFPVNWSVKLSSGSIVKIVFALANLKIGNKRIGPVTLTTPTLAAVNVDDDVAPLFRSSRSLTPCR